MKKISRPTADAAHRAVPASANPPAVLSTSTAAEDRVQELEEQLRAMAAIGASMAATVGLDVLFKELVPNISRLMRAERTTLFVYDDKTREIWSKVAQGHSLTEIRLELGQGIAGWAAEHRETINIKDAYADRRFNPEVDIRSGFKTRSVAAAPFIDRQGRPLGVLQVLNHEGGPFGEHDIGLLNFLAVGTSYAVENAEPHPGSPRPQPGAGSGDPSRRAPAGRARPSVSARARIGRFERPRSHAELDHRTRLRAPALPGRRGAPAARPASHPLFTSIRRAPKIARALFCTAAWSIQRPASSGGWPGPVSPSSRTHSMKIRVTTRRGATIRT